MLDYVVALPGRYRLCEQWTDRLIRGVKGFVSFSLVRTSEGGFSVSVFNDKSGTDESVRVARDWIAKNAVNTGVSAPSISEGTVVLQVG